MHALLEPWQQGIVQRAFIELALVGILGGALGCWVVFHGFSYSAESLAHALLPGLVGAALLGLPLVAGAAFGLAGAALAIALAAQVPGIGRDASVAIVTTTLFGLGVLLALSPSSPPGLSGLLFGDPLGVTGGDLVLTAAVAAASLGALGVLHRVLLVVGFDRVNATAFGARPAFADAALLVLVAASLLVGVQALGNLLVLAIVIGPAATARLLSRRMAPMMALAAGIAVAGAIAGLYLSYYANTAAGASVAIALVACFLLVLLARGVRRAPSEARPS
ncbi:MAG TPA: metal ABC transporter permease [Gaiellaceae bacterium]|jgi:ABC-type Mn2+/Zn2+ transport system permease subunit|nr:metal ABC transporter permease [Gaiellaceae bacterium]